MSTLVTTALRHNASASNNMVLDSNGRVGIGTATPGVRLDVTGDIRSSQSIRIGSGGAYEAGSIYSDGSWGMIFRAAQASPALAEFLWSNASDVHRMRIDTSGNLQFNSGYGSVATAFGCRAWVSFNGTGTIAIRGSGNITSLVDYAVGDYQANFTTALPDTNYSAVVTTGDFANNNQTNRASVVRDHQTTSVRAMTFTCTTASLADMPVINIAVFR